MGTCEKGSGEIRQSSERESGGWSGEDLEMMREYGQQLIRRLPAIGPVILLYLQSVHRRYRFVEDLEWLLLPPLVAGQSKLYMTGDYPTCFVSWAFLDHAAEQRLLAGGGRLRPEDWNVGDRLWLIDIIAPFGGTEAVLKDMRTMFGDRTIRVLAPDPSTGGVCARKIEPTTVADASYNGEIGGIS